MSVSQLGSNLAAADEMSNSTEQTLDGEPRPSDRSPKNQLREDQQQAQEWETLARAWVGAFPEAKAVTESQVEVWIDSNFGSLPADLQSMPRSELIERLLSIQNYLRFPSQTQEREPGQHDLPPARFQRTDQWIPVYSWLESLDTDEVVKSKDILDWLNDNPQVKDQLCSRHSRYHLMHYIKKCHLKILKRREKKVGSQPLNKESVLKVRKDVVAKKPAPVPNNPLNNIPKDSDLYIAKRNEALRKYEILLELEKKLSPVFSRKK
ncbi:hypothetical protein ERO13_D09G247400v2 [Gossypium hirsutum]|uniref:Uncharacterized protein n=4 Tax=Gossypium TaxID=3633 RepID=A0A1U8LZL5_GOSHI|nr:uncharacterized protein LOC105800836 isoform X1 [Gossypium raimondii]XP_016718843.1 uncharacterized protein LOC107931469 [Gossypium hirsutum]KAB2015026.1 hypothetical protein ES319_D09G268800v1 [Gossypium barbadense]TYG55601.1 hypothetical protein ES288_D09G287200v1 [Gossypium darwinii]KAG4131956.1 hypothetical protein ERO13_D09G247400v2 [Gossypium hirsutum]KJB38793.1 hypothetical protein B456_006G271900 [Gossypium raimondii]PPD75400.1 hypothetical protein GOBAR_DD27670 [Gossypium barbaden